VSYDIIGDIAIIKPPVNRDIEEYAKQIYERHKNVKTVLLQISKADFPYRVNKYMFIFGEKKTETIHKEYGLRFKVDVEKCYYSPRLENERIRIAKEVKDDEEVLVMFSGVNPYPIYISKFSKAKIIYSIELNPFAFKYGLENLKLNKVNNVISLLGDVREVCPFISFLNHGDGVIKNEEWYIKDFTESNVELEKVILFKDININAKKKYVINRDILIKDNKFTVEEKEYELFGKKFDRIVMPLPKGSENFLDIAIKLIKNEGIIHLYQFVKEEEMYDKPYELLKKYSKDLNFDYEILKIVKCGDIAPREYRICIDFKVYK